MNFDDPREILQLTAEALLHNLWQGLALAALVYFLLRLIPAARSGLRYGVAFAALILLVLVVPVTIASLSFTGEGNPTSSPQLEISEESGRSESVAVVSAAEPSRSELDRVIDYHEEALAGKSRRAGSKSWAAWVVAVWTIGFFAGLMRLLRSMVAVSALRKESEEFAGFSWEGLAQRCGLRKPVPIRVCRRVSVACVLGIVKPVVLLPLSMATAMPREQLELVIAHEFAHLRRLDPLWNLVQLFAEALLFFNPFLWWISGVVHAEREACCDQEAVRVTGRKNEYLEALLETAQAGLGGSFATASSFAGKGGKGSLLGRVRRLISPQAIPEMRLRWPVLFGWTAVIAVMLIAFQVGSIGVAKVLTAEERIREIEAVGEVYPQPSLERKEEFGRPDKDQEFEISGVLRGPDGSVPVGRIPIHSFSISGTSSIMASARAGSDGNFTASVRKGKAELLFEPENYAPFEFDLGQFDADRTGLEFILSEGFVGKLRFVDAESGEPLSGVELKTSVNAGRVQGFPKDRVSDEEGIVIVKHMSELPLKIEASLSGYGEGLWEKVSLEPGLIEELTLSPTEPLRIEVLSAEDGELLGDVSLRMVFRFSTGLNQSLDKSGPVIATSGEEGDLVATSLGAGSVYYFFVEKEGYESAFIGPLGAGGSTSVELRKSRPIRFEITGLPPTQSEVEVTLSQSLETPSLSSGIGRETVSSPVVDGGATILWSPPVRVPVRMKVADQQLSFSPEEWESGPIAIAFSTSADQPNVDQSSEPTVQLGMLEIRIRTPEGDPEAQGKLVVEYIENGDIKGKVRRMKKRVLGLREGVASLKVPYPNRIGIQPEGLIGYWIDPVRSHEISEPGATITVDAVPAGAIYGSVLEENGDPADSLLIGVFRRQKADENRSSNIGVEVKNSATQGDEQNRFLASPLPLGDQYVISVSRGFTYLFSKPVRLDEGSPLKELVLTLPEGIPVEGRVVRPDGTPAALQLMSFFIEADGGHGFARGGVITDGDGRFVIDGVNPEVRGKTYLEIEDVEGCQPKRWEINFGKSRQEIQLASGREVSGRVLDAATGKAVVGAEVYASREPYVPDAWPSWFKGGKTDAQGRFIFTNLPQGNFRINTRAGKGGEVEVQSGAGEEAVLTVELYEWFDGTLAD